MGSLRTGHSNNESMIYYSLKNKQMPWGSYGELLFAGINTYDKTNGNYYISRTAPYIPYVYRDISEPFLLITETLKKELEKSGLKGFSFQKAIKDRIVSLAWEAWDFLAEEPAIYPSGDMDAEEYILRRKHNKQLADEMEDIWAVLFPQKGLVLWGEQPTLLLQTAGDSDIFMAEYSPVNDIFVTERAMEWFHRHGNGDVYCEPYATRSGTDEEICFLEQERERYLYKKTRGEAMTDKDWLLWHRLISESERLLAGLSSAKREATKIKRQDKALKNLLKADELYPLQEKEKAIAEALKRAT